MYSQCYNNHYKDKDHATLSPWDTIKGNQFAENLLTLLLRNKATCTLIRLPVFTHLCFHFTEENLQWQFLLQAPFAKPLQGHQRTKVHLLSS